MIIYNYPLGFINNYGYYYYNLELGFIKKLTNILAVKAFFKVIINNKIHYLLLLPPIYIPVIYSDYKFTNNLIISPLI